VKLRTATSSPRGNLDSPVPILSVATHVSVFDPFRPQPQREPAARAGRRPVAV